MICGTYAQGIVREGIIKIDLEGESGKQLESVFKSFQRKRFSSAGIQFLFVNIL
jgi:hypothetical protein